MGQKPDALASYDKSLALNPQNPQLVSFDQALRAQLGSAPPPPSNSPNSSGNASGIAQDVLSSPNNAYTAGDTQTAAPAPNDPNNPAESNSWTAGHSHDRNLVDVNLGVAFYGGETGFGLGSTYYFPVSRNFSIGLGSNVYFFSSSYPTLYGNITNLQFFTEGLLLGKYSFGQKGIRPYLFGGGGLNALIGLTTGGSGYSSGSSFGFDPMLAFGGGVSIPLGEEAAFFIQAKISLVFGGINSSTTYNPYTGTNQTTTTGGSLSYVPVEAGFTLPM